MAEVYYKRKRGGQLRKKVVRICTAGNCSMPSRRKKGGLCEKHHKRKQREISTRAPSSISSSDTSSPEFEDISYEDYAYGSVPCSSVDDAESASEIYDEESMDVCKRPRFYDTGEILGHAKNARSETGVV